MESITPRTALFGPYSVDLCSGELRKFGRRARLGEQPFQILLMLLASPGEMVTREDLRAKLWADNTFVDFDHGLNSAVQRLRDCLSDTAEKPLWVETIPRHGYRFIGQVELRGRIGLSSPDEGSAPRVEAAQGGEDRVTEAVRMLARGRGGGQEIRRAAVWTAVVATLLLVWPLLKLSSRWKTAASTEPVDSHPIAVTDRDAIVLADFVNTTGDPVFDGTLRQGLSVQLEQTPFVQLISEDQVRQTLRLMEKPPDTRLTPRVAREVCQRANAAMEIEGSIAALGNQYVLGLNAVNCNTGETIAGEQVTADGKERVINALGSAASELRSKLGESHASLVRYDVPLHQDMTGSLEALQAFTRCAHEFDNFDWPTAISFCERATSLDPNFADAYTVAATAHLFMGDNSVAAEEIKKAYNLRDHASEEERFGITGAYYILGTGDLEKAIEADRLWTQTYPRDPYSYPQLAYPYRLLGRNEETLAAALEAVRLDPTDATVADDIVIAYARQGHLDKARATLEDLEARHLNSPDLLWWFIDFLQNDSAGMAEHLARMPNYGRFSIEASSAAYAGKLSDSRGFTQRAIAYVPRGTRSETGALDKAESALWEALFGDSMAARESAMDASKMTTVADWDVQGITALSLALAGETAQSRKLASDLNRRFPERTMVQFSYLPAIQAALALHQGNPQEAIEGLRAASPYELGEPGKGTPMMPVYVRGQAYLALHQGAQAASEFQRILDNRGLVGNDPIGALAHLGLGRAYAMQGDTAKARTAYQDFLTLWKDADLEIPLLKQAKAENAMLK
jgi:DNA-binding winged helix-turn-helix (wHTH) protein/tetratricopeptide (TPR) repeat protein